MTQPPRSPLNAENTAVVTPAPRPVRRIYLIRHGQTVWNVDGRWQGNIDVPLSDIGVEQAGLLAKYLESLPIRVIYTSDLSRAAQTAEALAHRLGIPAQTDTRLQEIHLGIFQGLTRDEIIAQHPDEWARYIGDFEFVVPQGESRRLMQTRMVEIFQQIADEAEGDTAIFTHGGSIRMLLRHLMADDGAGMANVHIHNTSITIIETDAITHRLISIAKVPHLPEMADGVDSVT